MKFKVGDKIMVNAEGYGLIDRIKFNKNNQYYCYVIENCMLPTDIIDQYARLDNRLNRVLWRRVTDVQFKKPI